MPIKIYKPIGVTPVQLVEKYKKENSIDEKVSFAGRLDPMARGEILILIGDECKKQDSFFGKDKIYEFEILYGFTTDTLDILGISRKDEKHINNDVKKLKGEYEQPYPLYSSKFIGNRKRKTPHDLVKEIREKDEVPKKKVFIFELEKLDEKNVSNSKLLDMISKKLALLSEEYRERFRYSKIKNKWEENLKLENTFYIERYKAKVSSGTYIRSLCERMGGIAYDINRLEVL